MVFNQIINGIEVTALYADQAVESVFLPLLKRLSDMQRSKGRRLLVFLAAPPAAGKSTMAAFMEHLSAATSGITPIQAIGMDGFHRYQEDLLCHSTLRDGKEVPLVNIKGAPITFDLKKLTERITQVASGENSPWPSYDRLLHDPQENAIFVTGDIVLLEGNYLLLDRPGWRDLKQYADFSIFISADPNDLRERLIARKASTSAGSVEEARAFVDFSDLPNAIEVLEHSQKPDVLLRMLPDGSYIQM